jgi:hypothetical protein
MAILMGSPPFCGSTAQSQAVDPRELMPRSIVPCPGERRNQLFRKFSVQTGFSASARS